MGRAITAQQFILAQGGSGDLGNTEQDLIDKENKEFDEEDLAKSDEDKKDSDSSDDQWIAMMLKKKSKFA